MINYFQLISFFDWFVWTALWNADLSTLASVVTSLASMRSVEAFGGSGMNNSTSSPVPNVKMEEDDDSEDSGSTNDEAAVANALHLAKENIISKAIDTMAKVRRLWNDC